MERERLRSRRSRERERNRGAGSRSGVRHQWGRPAPRCCAGQARGAGRRGRKLTGRGGRASLPSGASRRGVSAGSAGDRARCQAERPGDSTRWADQHRGRREVGQAPRRHSLACARSRSGTDRAHAAGGASRTGEQRLSPQFAGVGTQCREAARERNGVERLQSSESGANGATKSPRSWRQQGARISWRGKSSNGARGPRLSPVVKARNVRRQPGDSIMLPRSSPTRAIARVLPKPVREAANFCADIARLKASHQSWGWIATATLERRDGFSARDVAKGPPTLTH